MASQTASAAVTLGMVLAAAIAAAVSKLRRSIAMGSSELAVSAVSIFALYGPKGWRSAALALFGHIPCRDPPCCGSRLVRTRQRLVLMPNQNEAGAKIKQLDNSGLNCLLGLR